MIVGDTFHETLRGAMMEAARRRSDAAALDFMTKVEKSRYGGYRVRSYPIDLVVDQLTETPMMGAPSGIRYHIEA